MTIDGGADSAVMVPAGQIGSVVGFNLRSDVSAVSIEGAGTVANNTFDGPNQTTNGDVHVQGPGPTTHHTQRVHRRRLGRLGHGDPDRRRAASASLSRNTISGYGIGVDVGDTTGAVTLGSDLMFANAMGLEMEADVSAMNVTLWGNGDDISTTDAHLALDSSIIEDQIDTNASAATCDITFSRGPPADPCDSFQTSADPMFIRSTPTTSTSAPR